MSNWGDNFANAFLHSREMAQQRSMVQMRIDAELGTRGYERMEGSDIKDYLVNQQRPSYSTKDEGSAVIPTDSKLTNGQVLNKTGQVVGEYAPGYEPKPLKDTEQTGSVIRVGNNYYRWNEDLAKRISGQAIKPTVKDLNKSFSGVAKTFNLPGGNLTVTNKQGVSHVDIVPTQEQTQQPIAQPVSSAPNDLEMRKSMMQQAVQNAVKQGASQDEIMAGIQEEGFNPNEFMNLSMAQPQDNLRQYALNGVLGGVGFSQMSNDDIKRVLINQLERKVKKYTGRAVV
jgi:hypothetical protein